MLTGTKLRTLKPKAKLYRVADANGLAIEVSTTGAKLWRYRYRYLGKASMAALGEYPAVSLSDARAERDRLRALLQGGANPATVLRAEREAKAEHAANTFGAVADEPPKGRRARWQTLSRTGILSGPKGSAGLRPAGAQG